MWPAPLLARGGLAQVYSFRLALQKVFGVIELSRVTAPKRVRRDVPAAAIAAMMVASSIFIIQPPYPGLTSLISICSSGRARRRSAVRRQRGRAWLSAWSEQAVAPRLYRNLDRHATNQRGLLPHQEAGRVVMAAVIKI
jgi:hypothetical protein